MSGAILKIIICRVLENLRSGEESAGERLASVIRASSSGRRRLFVLAEVDLDFAMCASHRSEIELIILTLRSLCRVAKEISYSSQKFTSFFLF